MKKLSLFIISYITVISHIAAQKQIFSVPHLEDSLKKHETVAILPLQVTLSYERLPKDFDPEANKAGEKKTGLNMQQTMYINLLQKADEYSISFQDIDTTNALITRAGIADSFYDLFPDSIAKVLGVDAIIKASYSFKKKRSEGGAMANSLIFGVGGSKGTGSLTMQIYSGASGALLWRFYDEMKEQALPSGDEELIERMMRKISKDFPYTK